MLVLVLVLVLALALVLALVLVLASDVPAAAVPNPASVVSSEGATIVAPRDWRTENAPPVAPP